MACIAAKAASALAVRFCAIFSLSSLVLPQAVSAISVITLAPSWAAVAVFDVEFLGGGNALLRESLHVLRNARVLEELLGLVEGLLSELLVHGAIHRLAGCGGWRLDGRVLVIWAISLCIAISIVRRRITLA